MNWLPISKSVYKELRNHSILAASKKADQIEKPTTLLGPWEGENPGETTDPRVGKTDMAYLRKDSRVETAAGTSTTGGKPGCSG